MDAKTILIFLAAVCFGIDALNGILRINLPILWTAAGFCFLTIALLLI